MMMARHLAVPMLSNLTIQQRHVMSILVTAPHIVRRSPGSLSLLLRVLHLGETERGGGGEVGDGADVVGAGHAGVTSCHHSQAAVTGPPLSVSGVRGRC